MQGLVLHFPWLVGCGPGCFSGVELLYLQVVLHRWPSGHRSVLALDHTGQHESGMLKTKMATLQLVQLLQYQLVSVPSPKPEMATLQLLHYLLVLSAWQKALRTRCGRASRTRLPQPPVTAKKRQQDSTVRQSEPHMLQAKLTTLATVCTSTAGSRLPSSS